MAKIELAKIDILQSIFHSHIRIMLNGKWYNYINSNLEDTVYMQPAVKYITDFPPSEGIKYTEELWNSQHGDAFVVINCKASNIYYPEHWTPLSIKCAFNGKEYYKLKSTTYAVSDQNFLVLNEGAEYSSYILSETVTESFTLNFTQNNLQVLSATETSKEEFLLDDPFIRKNNSTSFLQKLYTYSPAVTCLVYELKLNCTQRNKDTLRTQELIYSLLKELFLLNKLSCTEADSIHAKKGSTRIELYKRLSIAKDYLSSCYHENISLEQLAKTCHLNPYHLLREFKTFYRITPHQYLTSTRLQAAKRLMTDADKSISQIIHEIGFQDAASFSKLFKKQFGLTPSAFRKLTTAINYHQ